MNLTDTSLTGNTATGTGSQTGGLHNSGAGLSLTNTAITQNTSPPAPAPGGFYSDNSVTDGGSNTVLNNSPTNCLLSPVIPPFCPGT